MQEFLFTEALRCVKPCPVKDEVADTIGLTSYAVDSEGIGGVLKSRIADFRVDEISTKISLDPRGRFTAANITLTNWETNQVHW